ncbi:MAG TPA: DUF1127 domain-containing protein [Stellaceae bacterium]
MRSIDDGGAASDEPAFAASPPARRHSRWRQLVAEWWARARSRRRLARLDERMLRDIGIDRARVWQETRKWFWQP